jgi:hypothetical protein
MVEGGGLAARSPAGGGFGFGSVRVGGDVGERYAGRAKFLSRLALVMEEAVEWCTREVVDGGSRGYGLGYQSVATRKAVITLTPYTQYIPR